MELKRTCPTAQRLRDCLLLIVPYGIETRDHIFVGVNGYHF